MKTTRLLHGLFCGLVAVYPATSAHAQTFDARFQFSTTSNPAGAWSYGWQPSLVQPFVLGTVHGEIGGGFHCWGPPPATSVPFVGKNVTGAPIRISDNPVVPGGVMMFHPGSANQRAAVRWTSPGAGRADIYIRVGGVTIDPDFVSTDIAILHNANVLATSSAYNNTSTYSFNASRDVAAGDTIDLSQGFGTNGSYLNDSTALLFTVILNACAADLNGDGVVDDADFSIFAPQYDLLDCGDPAMPLGCPADLNRDGVVDDVDFSIFVVAYDNLLCL